MVTEVGMRPLEIPPGYVGNLTDEQEGKLREMWVSFFACCDSATGTARADDAGNGDPAGDPSTEQEQEQASGGLADLSKSGIPKDDAAKEEVKRQLEERELKALLSTYGSDALRDTFWKFCKSDNPDTNMLRFLRARKWDVKRSIAMMATMLKWRLDSGVEVTAEKGDLGLGATVPKFLDQQRTGKIYALGASLQEQPVCYVHLKKHLTFGQPAASMQKFIIYQMETWRLFMVPPNDKMIILFDLAGFGLRNLDVFSLLYVVKCLEAYYPESLGCMMIHRAPYIFQPVWKMVRGLLDPVVRNKVRFTKNADDLLEYIPKDRMLKIVGGDVEQDFVFIEPAEGENDRVTDKASRDRIWANHMRLATEFEDCTRKWCATDGKDSVLSEQRLLLAKMLRLSQFDVEQYARGMTIHHRDMTLPLSNQGMVKWEYHTSSGDVRQVVGHKYSRKALEREIVEISQGASVKDAEAKSEQLISNGEWGDWRTVADLDPAIRSEAAKLIGGTGAQPVGLAALALSNADAIPDADRDRIKSFSAQLAPPADAPASEVSAAAAKDSGASQPLISATTPAHSEQPKATVDVPSGATETVPAGSPMHVDESDTASPQIEGTSSTPFSTPATTPATDVSAPLTNVTATTAKPDNVNEEAPTAAQEKRKSRFGTLKSKLLS